MNFITGTIMGRFVSLIHGKGQKVHIFAKVVNPNLPIRDGLVLVELPPNCYIDPLPEEE